MNIFEKIELTIMMAIGAFLGAMMHPPANNLGAKYRLVSFVVAVLSSYYLSQMLYLGLVGFDVKAEAAAGIAGIFAWMGADKITRVVNSVLSKRLGVKLDE